MEAVWQFQPSRSAVRTRRLRCHCTVEWLNDRLEHTETGRHEAQNTSYLRSHLADQNKHEVSEWSFTTGVSMLVDFSATTLLTGQQEGHVPYATNTTSTHCDSWLLCAIRIFLLTYLLLLLHPFNGLFSRTTWVSWYQKGKTSLNLNDGRDDGVLRCSGISWTICKQSAPHIRHRQITTPTPNH